MATTHQGFARYYRPHDIYVGNLITALGCIDAGITCVIDNSHNSRSAAHSDAAVQALIDSGIRGVHASGAPQTGDWDRQWPQDLERLQKQFFASDDQLVTLRMFSGMNRENWALARRLGLRITTESNAAGPEFEQFWNEKLLRPRQHVQPLPGLARHGVAARQGSPAPRSTSARGRTRSTRSAKVCRRFRRRSITACGRASASTTRCRTAPTCSPRCASRSTSSGRWPRIGRTTGDAKAPGPDRRARRAGVRDDRRRRVRRAAGQVRHADAGQGSRHRHDSHRRHQPVSVEPCHRHGRRRGRHAERRHGHHRRPRAEAPWAGWSA